jgi:cyanate permease
LIAGLILLALIALDGWLHIGRWFRVAGVSQVHLLVVGWITQLAIGVAYWMFPRFLKEDNPRPRGSDTLAWAVYICLNAGLVLRLAAEPFHLLTGQSWLAALVALSGVLQAAAAVGFGLLIWARIRPLE